MSVPNRFFVYSFLTRDYGNKNHFEYRNLNTQIISCLIYIFFIPIYTYLSNIKLKKKKKKTCVGTTINSRWYRAEKPINSRVIAD